LPCLTFFGRAVALIRRTRQCAFNALEQFGVSKWLRKKVDCACLHHSRAHGNVAVPCDEDELLLAAPLNQSFLEINAIEARHPYINNQTGRSRVWIARQKLRCRAEDFALVAGRS